MENDIEKKPETMDKMYSSEQIDFMCQYKMRSAVMMGFEGKLRRQRDDSNQ